MSEIKNMEVEFIDDDHIYISGKQWVSLNRFLKAKNDLMKETYLVNNKNERLAKENEALKLLLKNQLNNETKCNEEQL